MAVRRGREEALAGGRADGGERESQPAARLACPQKLASESGVAPFASRSSSDPPAASSSRITSTCPAAAADASGCTPFAFLRLMSAAEPTSAASERTISTFPAATASPSGESPAAFTVRWRAPAATSLSTHAVWPLDAAASIGVSFVVLGAFMSHPSERRWSRTSTCP